MTVSATLPNGLKVAKNSKVPYAYVVAVQTPAGSWFAARWSRSLPSALEAAGRIWPSYPDRRVIAVDA